MKNLKDGFRPLSGLCLLFRFAEAFVYVEDLGFRPLSGLCLLFRRQVISRTPLATRFPSPFGVMSLILFVDVFYYNGKFESFRPLSGLCLLFMNQNKARYDISNVSVPFRGYVSYSKVRRP